MAPSKEEKCRRRIQRESRTNFCLLVFLAGGILLQLGDLGGQKLGRLVRVGRFLRLVFLRHGGGRHFDVSAWGIVETTYLVIRFTGGWYEGRKPKICAK